MQLASKEKTTIVAKQRARSISSEHAPFGKNAKFWRLLATFNVTMLQYWLQVLRRVNQTRSQGFFPKKTGMAEKGPGIGRSHAQKNTHKFVGVII